ncbi:hypothetical protein niasHS_008263 [Heterodera schachtii]|uniref:Uncharacterized protein n=1 Tax=Heterodera schachtii TaxID=97005 RepID=A0ABD2IZ73_HETSC
MAWRRLNFSFSQNCYIGCLKAIFVITFIFAVVFVVVFRGIYLDQKKSIAEMSQIVNEVIANFSRPPRLAKACCSCCDKC